jgi:hypothetical protein
MRSKSRQKKGRRGTAVWAEDSLEFELTPMSYRGRGGAYHVGWTRAPDGGGWGEAQGRFTAKQARTLTASFDTGQLWCHSGAVTVVLRLLWMARESGRRGNGEGGQGKRGRPFHAPSRATAWPPWRPQARHAAQPAWRRSATNVVRAGEGESGARPGQLAGWA